MKTFLMFITLLQLDPYGNIFTTPMVENPSIEYKSFDECWKAAEIKRKTMLESSKKYPELGVFDIRIDCRSDIILEDEQSI